MLAQRQIAALPDSGDAAFGPDKASRFAEIRRAHLAIAPMFWGPRIGIDEACGSDQEWIKKRM